MNIASRLDAIERMARRRLDEPESPKVRTDLDACAKLFDAFAAEQLAKLDDEGQARLARTMKDYRP